MHTEKNREKKNLAAILISFDKRERDRQTDRQRQRERVKGGNSFSIRGPTRFHRGVINSNVCGNNRKHLSKHGLYLEACTEQSEYESNQTNTKRCCILK